MSEVEEFEAFVRTHGSRLRRLAFLLCRDVHRAEDLSQSALAKSYRHWSRISAMEQPFAYVSRIVVREATSWRRLRSSSEVVTEDHTLLVGHSVPDHAADIANADAVWELLGNLPPKQRAVIVLRYYIDMPDDQIARTMGCSINTVRSNASRALATLRKEDGTKEPEVAHDH